MDGVKGDDPFLWDVDAVVRELASPGRPWTRDPTSIEACIQAEEIDGKTLLIYDHLFSLQELMDCLRIRLARHKAALGEAIVHLRSRSRAYQSWVREFARRQQVGDYNPDEDEANHDATESNATPDLSNAVRQSSDLPPSLAPVNEDQLPDANPQTDPTSTTNELEQAAQQRLSNEAQPQPLQPQSHLLVTKEPSPPVGLGSIETRQQDGDERPAKRKRLAPTVLDSRPRNPDPVFLPTEADMITHPYVDDRDFPWEMASQHAYLGDGSLSAMATVFPEEPLSSLIIEPDDNDDNTFSITAPNRIPPGRKLVANRRVKRLLVSNGRGKTDLETVLQGEMNANSSRPFSPESYGISDLEEDLDEESLREMEQERLEKERLAALDVNALITPQRAKEVLDEAISVMTAAWHETKLPRYQKRAYGLWQRARRKGTRRRDIYDAHEQVRKSKGRMEKICQEILSPDQNWKKESHIRDQAKCLEQTLADRLYQTWFIDMLESSCPPPKPQGIPQSKPKAAQQVTDLLDEEILTSSDEDEFITPEDDFIVPDEDQLSGGDPMDIVHEMSSALEPFPQALKEESPECTDYIDLTQNDPLPPTPMDKNKSIFIDLCSPAKSAESPQLIPQEDSRPPSPLPEAVPASNNREIADPPSLEMLGDIQKIGSIPPKKWARKNDRWRLLVCLMWRLAHSRRRALLDLVVPKEPNVLWNSFIQSYISSPPANLKQLTESNPKTVMFDLVRLFHCFFQCQNNTEETVVGYNIKKLRKRLYRARGSWFNSFCGFVKALASEFPQDSQVYRQGLHDPHDNTPLNSEDELDDLDDDDEGEERTGAKGRRAPKEIIQDKDGMDLRERETQRLQEQEARRVRLLETLAEQGTMPEDRTRLIINESKEEGQSLVYINEGIGKYIKFHQIEGVRFLWNQIVQDSQTRQGCLLAHTMGLGKTMQVITFLVALAEASASEDARAQIPEDLRATRALVLMPSSLVDNWMDELLIWTPKGVLGELRKVHAKLLPQERAQTIAAWASGGGVLLIGYPMFRMTLAMSDETADLLAQTPNIVIADEAHYMKNPRSQTSIACQRFKTQTRIALTGSPLANRVQEYQSMIDWVAPNFLGPPAEFREIYAIPIQVGFYYDSSAYERREAMRTLETLARIVDPKVHRRTMEVLKDDLPPKYEFIIFVPPTELQKRLYEIYLNGVDRDDGRSGAIANRESQQAQIFAMANHLGLICGHPKCFQAKVKKMQKGESSAREDDEKQADMRFPRSVIPEFMKALKVPDLGTPSLSWKTELLTVILDEARKVEDKVLVFSQSLDTLDYLENMCMMQKRRALRLDGSTKLDTRQAMIKRFNEGALEVFLISTTAGGLGLNIQGANRVVIFDIKWNPVDDVQAVGRAYRLKQTKPVFVYHLMVAGTFEEILHNKHIFKTQLASRVVDKANPVSWSKRKGKVVGPINPTPAEDLTPFIGKDVVLDQLIGLRKGGDAIRSIVSTDTFKEEDFGAQLTAEDTEEVNRMVEGHKILVRDPVEYKKNRSLADEREQARLLREQALPMSSLGIPSHRPLHQLFDGASDIPGHRDDSFSATAPTLAASRQPVEGHSTVGSHRAPFSDSSVHPSIKTGGPSPQLEPHTLGPVPMPMAGANTFFGKHQRSAQASAQVPMSTQVLAPPQTPATGPATSPDTTHTPKEDPKSPRRSATQSIIFKEGGLFNVSQIPAKVEFEKHLRERIRILQERDVPRTDGVPDQLARAVTDTVDSLRKERSFGFLPDTQHWKHLYELLGYDKFVISIIAGHLSAEYVALASKEELEKRIQTINGLDESDIPAQGHRRLTLPDPNV
ncbi:hypothetical protein FZEAL_172 [Fusarium zealandicum]|uniref:Helicase n=1 Tax=Fusarium zealandicum TaxID=1053134 RepID=A0A8H4UV58_9HYPO|nr:hypothetical protein FZEAL_172 [Fusarium zealandicum]